MKSIFPFLFYLQCLASSQENPMYQKKPSKPILELSRYESPSSGYGYQKGIHLLLPVTYKNIRIQIKTSCALGRIAWQTPQLTLLVQ
jgi:hypothetical protein